MSGAALPPVIPEPFAKNADPAFIQNPIPETTGVSGRASYDQGFPAITMQPIAAGGKAPFGQDFNGLFFALTSQQYFAQCGQLWPFNADVLAAITGYAAGTVLGSSDGKTVWMNIVDGNTTDPDGGSAAGWVSLFTYGYTTKTLTGGAYTLTPLEARASTIIINGVLAGNQAIILPLQLREWLIVNNTTGSATLTVRGATGTGVAIPQGGFNSPVGVYSEGTNFYPTVPAVSLIPADQAATSLTLAQRTNTGQILATFFHTTAPIEAAGGISNVFCEGAGADEDGLIRKFSLAYFETVMNLSAIGGAVTAGQVPSSAVTQYAAAILASAALTGTPTAPTAAVNTSSTQVASTAFANPSSAVAMPGYFKLPSGHIVQYGIANPNGGAVTVNLSVPYSAAGNYVIVAMNTSGSSTAVWNPTASKTASAFGLQNTGGTSFWITIGF